MPRKRDSDLLVALGKRLQVVRREQGWSQAALAETVDIEPTTLSRYETGDRALSLSVLLKLADSLGVLLGDLVDAKRKLPKTKLAGTSDERELLRLYRKLDGGHQDLAIRIVREVGKG